MKKLRRLIISLPLLGMVSAQASVPITDERALCNASSVLIATIIDAESKDCWLNDPTKQCGARTIRIKMHVDSVLRNGDNLQSKQNIEADAPFRNGLPIILENGFVIPMNGDGEFDLAFPATGKAVETSEARDVLLGKQLAFSVRSVDADGVYSVYSWHDIEWAKTTLANC